MPPSLDIFVKNEYRKYDSDYQYLSEEKIRRIVDFNAFGLEEGRRDVRVFIFGLLSFINHSTQESEQNIKLTRVDNIRLCYAQRDIAEGEQIHFDYEFGESKAEKIRMAKHGIFKEEVREVAQNADKDKSHSVEPENILFAPRPSKVRKVDADAYQEKLMNILKE